MSKTIKVLVTGICGHSYGSQIAKSLSLLSNQYEIYGSDMMKQYLAEEIKLSALFELPRASESNYLPNLRLLYHNNNIDYLIDGSEAEQKILNQNREFLHKNKIQWITNQEKVLNICSNKNALISFLKENNLHHPKVYSSIDFDYLKESGIFPLVLKPNTNFSGSAHVYVAQNSQDVQAIFQLSKLDLNHFCIQEYIGDADSEYTVGILHNNKGKFIGSCTLKRDLTQSLSVKIAVKNITSRKDLSEKLIISSGFSQGSMMNHPAIEKYCRQVAEKLGSVGPLNFQGRWWDDKFYIFEINPRFSGTSFMRALSGFNEADLWIKHANETEEIKPYSMKKNVIFRRVVKEIMEI